MLILLDEPCHELVLSPRAFPPSRPEVSVGGVRRRDLEAADGPSSPVAKRVRTDVIATVPSVAIAYAASSPPLATRPAGCVTAARDAGAPPLPCSEHGRLD